MAVGVFGVDPSKTRRDRGEAIRQLCDPQRCNDNFLRTVLQNPVENFPISLWMVSGYRVC
jgi:hypothetical protein